MKKRTLTMLLIICGLLLITSTIIYGICLSITASTKESKEDNIPAFIEKEKDNLVYLECMNSPFYSENTKTLIKEFLDSYQNENIAIYFKEINNQYTITLNENENFYGASLIKLLESTYLIRKAQNNEINLDDKIVYKESHISDYSLGMENYKVGDEIPIKELIKFVISYSDNTAHEMLYEYIGIENLKEYSRNLGISLTINDKEHFGLLNASSTNIMLEEAYDIISNSQEYKELLTVFMDNDYYNSLNFDEIRILHKYGLSEPSYNDIGIYNTDTPYLISILTSYGYQDYETKVKEISKKLYNIYQTNIDEKQSYCKDLQNAFIS